MKRLFFFLSSALVFAACTKEANVELVKFSDSGCTRETKVEEGFSGGNAGSQLVLRYSQEGLVVIRTNAIMNCSIGRGGISYDVSSDGNVISYHAYETDGPIAKCVCPVGDMTTTVAGLRVGREYVLEYECSDAILSPVSFTYSKDLNLVIDVDLYKLSANY